MSSEWKKCVYLLFVVFFSTMMYLLLTMEYMSPAMNTSNLIIAKEQTTGQNLCDTSDWTHEILSNFVALNNYSTLTNIALSPANTIDIILSDLKYLKLQKQPILFTVSASLSLDESLGLWRELYNGSLYLQKVSNTNDIANMARYLELSNNHCCFSNGYWRETVLNYERMFVDDIFCSKCACIVQKQDTQLLNDGRHKNGKWFQTANQTKTDKIPQRAYQHIYDNGQNELSAHEYQHLYDKHLQPFYHSNRGIVLEIGLGCDMWYEPGESAKIWTKLFANVHFIEYDRECNYKNHSNFYNYTVHIGDQANVTFLEEIKSVFFGKGLDIVIDDGGHYNREIITSFLSLWHVVNPNGLYFVEDYGQAAYMLDKFDALPIRKFGEEQPGAAQFLFKSLLSNLFCAVSKKSCYDIKYIECRMDICVIQKMSL